MSYSALWILTLTAYIFPKLSICKIIYELPLSPTLKIFYETFFTDIYPELSTATNNSNMNKHDNCQNVNKLTFFIVALATAHILPVK